MTNLRVQDVSIDVAGRRLLTNISLDVPNKGLHVVLGPSGSGKTTLLKAIAGLHPLAHGEIRLDVQRVDGRPPHLRGIVLLHQEDTLFPHLDVARNIAFAPRLHGASQPAIDKNTAELLELVGLAGFERRRIDHLSGGERQRVALARALAAEPRVLLLDEPFSSLDRALRQSLREDLRRILHARGTTALFVTHDREEALSLADELVLLDRQVVDRGPPGRVFQRPATVEAARVLGRRNLLSLDAWRRVNKRTTAPGSGGWALVNEEDVELRAASDGAGTLESAEFLGTYTRYRIRIEGSTVHAETPGPPRWRPGDAVEVDWAPPAFQPFPDPGKTPQS